MPAYDTPTGAKKKLSTAEEETLLEEIRSRYDYAVDGWREAHAAGDKDMASVAGDPWDPADRAAREKLGRPCLALDEIGQYIHQIVNDVRANPIAMKFDPTGNGASEQGAEFYQDKAREIEYRSNAQVAYTTAFENAVQRGFGWCRLKTTYANERTEEQELSLEAIEDPNAVVADPDARRPDSSDMKYLFYVETWDQKEFARRWPTAKIQDFSGDIARSAPSWIKGETRIMVGEYWKIKTETRKLGLWQPPPTPGPDGAMIPTPPVKLFEDEALEKLPKGSTWVQHLRDVEYPSVCQYLTNGVEILETTEWAGKYIPFASCFAKVIYINQGTGTKRIFLSATRLAHDPYMLYCYYRTQQAEMAGMIPKVPVGGYKGQFRGMETEWQKAPHEPLAFLEFGYEAEGWNPSWGPMPPPRRIEYSAGEHLQALELCAEGARRAIQSAMMGSPLPTQAQRHNEKSGVALKQIDSNAQKGSFHFYDHYKDMVRHVGVMVEDLMDKIYDTARDVGTRQANEQAKQQRINDPTDPESIDTRGDYLVTVSTGPSFDSQRDEASDFADTLAQNPQVFPLIGPMVVRLKKLGPIGDEIAEALEALQPPELRKKKEGEQGPDPRMLAAENGQLKQQLQQASQIIQTEQHKGQAQIEKTKIDAQVSMQIEQMKAQLAIELRKMQDATAIRVAEIAAQVKGLVTGHDAAHEAAALHMAQQHEAIQNERDRQHEALMAQQAHDQQLEQQEQGQAHALEAGEASHAQQLDAQAQAAQQQPEAGA